MSKLTALTELTTIANGDLFMVVDISDTTMDATGTNKKLTYSGLITLLNTSLASSFEVPLTFSTGLTRTTNTITVNTTQNIAKLSNLTANGFVKTSGGDGTLSIDTNTYLTSTSISDTAYGVGWNGDTTTAPSKNAVYDEIELRATKASPTFTGTVTLPTGLTGVLRADSGVVSTDSDVTDLVTASSDTTAGKVELATSAETTTGTDTGRAITPDGLAGSDYGKRVCQVLVSDPTGSAITTGDGKAGFRISSALNGYNLVGVAASLGTVSSSGAVTVMVRRSRRTNATTRSSADMLSTAITIDVSEFDTEDAATPAVINGSNDDVQTGDHIYIDIDGAGTGAKGLIVELVFQLP